MGEVSAPSLLFLNLSAAFNTISGPTLDFGSGRQRLALVLLLLLGLVPDGIDDITN